MELIPVRAILILSFIIIIPSVHLVNPEDLSCPGSPDNNNTVGKMDCTVPNWTFGRYLHEIKFPSRCPGLFYYFTKLRVQTAICKVGTCFMFSQQECVKAAQWRSDCKSDKKEDIFCWVKRGGKRWQEALQLLSKNNVQTSFAYEFLITRAEWCQRYILLCQ